MAITPTTFKNLTFGGVNSADYGVYISGEGVYNAPARAVELTQIPGRNGAIPVDLGRWENIEITYPCGMFGSDQTDFAQNYSDFINAIASQKGYQRLEDTYHTDEFRQALFVSGVETKPIGFGQAGEFELVFNCKPQRFLKSGEAAVAIANNGTITNPTLLDSAPIIELKGYGAMTIGDYSLELQNIPLGAVQVATSGSVSVATARYDIVIDDNMLLANDPIEITQLGANVALRASKGLNPNGTNTYYNSGTLPASILWGYVSTPGIGITPALSFNLTSPIQFAYGTPSSFSRSVWVTFTATDSATTNINVELFVDYMPASDPAIIRIRREIIIQDFITGASSLSADYGAITAVSSYPNTGNPAYIDCEIGEAYKIEGGEMVSINGASFLGAELPRLVPGANTITYDNTVTSFKLVPRWWKL